MLGNCTEGQPGVGEILKKVSRTYKAASSFELVAELTPLESSRDKRETGQMVFAFRDPNRYRMEMTEMREAPSTKAIVVHDGSTLWMHSSDTNEYVSAPSSPMNSVSAPEDPLLMWRFRKAATSSKGPSCFGKRRSSSAVPKWIATSCRFLR